MASPRKTEVLQLLRDSKDYVSGQQICEFFGISRTAVWKIINQLKEEGYEIEAVQNKGYHLTGAPDVLSLSELQSRMKTKMANPIFILSAVPHPVLFLSRKNPETISIMTKKILGIRSEKNANSSHIFITNNRLLEVRC